MLEETFHEWDDGYQTGQKEGYETGYRVGRHDVTFDYWCCLIDLPDWPGDVDPKDPKAVSDYVRALQGTIRASERFTGKKALVMQAAGARKMDLR
jgi:hypothetical protein